MVLGWSERGGPLRAGRRRRRRAAKIDGDRAAAVDWGCGGVWELRKARAVLMAGSARAERRWRCGATVSFELAGVRVAVVVFWGVEAGSWGMSARIRMRGSSACWGARKKERQGSIPCCPRRRRGGSRGARQGRRGEERGLQHEGEWVQEFAGVPRVAVG